MLRPEHIPLLAELANRHFLSEDSVLPAPRISKRVSLTVWASYHVPIAREIESTDYTYAIFSL